MAHDSEPFDPYRKWLGIASRRRPPSHYKLLGLSLDEDDPEVIQAAAEQRRSFIESQLGKGRDGEANALLYHIHDAEMTLLDADLRRKYDRRLNLFRKRRKDRPADPFAVPAGYESRPGRSVGEDSGIVRTAIGVMAVLLVGF